MADDPQLYVKGEFVGGCDIVREMYETGELVQYFCDKGVETGRTQPNTGSTNPIEFRPPLWRPLHFVNTRGDRLMDSKANNCRTGFAPYTENSPFLDRVEPLFLKVDGMKSIIGLCLRASIQQ